MMRTDTTVVMKARKSLALLITGACALALAACGGGGGGGAAVTFTPATATVAAGASIPLAVTASGVTDLSMNFTASGGTVSQTGVYTAPATPGVYTVTATSKANSAVSGTATITVTALALGGGSSYSGAFANVSSMKTARTNFPATLLATGNVLVCGGLGEGGTALNKAEFFNPNARAFGHFSSVGNMKAARAYHTATILMNGKVLVAGGIDDSNTALASAEIFDPATNTFTATGSMTAPRWMHSATLLPNGKVLIAGGTSVNPAVSSGIEGNAPLASAELYDPVTGTFTALSATLVQPRYDHTATLLNSGKVLLAGGQGNGGQTLPDTELFDPVAATFTATTGNMLVDNTVDTGRWLFTSSLLPDGTVIVVGGDPDAIFGTPNFLNSAQIYDPTASTFSDLASMMTYARAHHAVGARVGGSLLVTGGIGTDVSDPNNIAPADFLAAAELYDPTGKTFSLTGTMHNARANHITTSLANGKILVAGGNNAGTFLKSAEIYQ